MALFKWSASWFCFTYLNNVYLFLQFTAWVFSIYDPIYYFQRICPHCRGSGAENESEERGVL